PISTPIQSAAPSTASRAVRESAISQPRRQANQGVTVGESMPPRLLPKFITPPPTPLRDPEIWVMLAQKGPSVTSTSTVESVRLATAHRALSVRAPITSKPEATRRAGNGTARLPQVAPQRLTAQSERTPPTGMAIRLHAQGKVVSHAARSRLKCRT